MAKRFVVPRAEAGGMSAQRIKPVVGTSPIRGEALPTPAIDTGRSNLSMIPSKDITDLGDTVSNLLASASANDVTLAVQERKMRINLGNQQVKKDLITSSDALFTNLTDINGNLSEAIGKGHYDAIKIDEVVTKFKEEQIVLHDKKYKDKDSVFYNNTIGDFYVALEAAGVNLEKKLHDFVTNDLTNKTTLYANDLVEELNLNKVDGLTFQDDDQLRTAYGTQSQKLLNIVIGSQIDSIVINDQKIAATQLESYLNAKLEIHLGSKSIENRLIKSNGETTRFLDYNKIRTNVIKEIDDPNLQLVVEEEINKLETKQDIIIGKTNEGLIKEYINEKITLPEAREQAILYNTKSVSDFNNALTTYKKFVNSEGGVDDYKILNVESNKSIRNLVARELVRDVHQPLKLDGEDKAKSILDRYLDSNDQTVGTATFNYATKVFDGDLGNQKSFYKEFDIAIDAIRKDPVVRSVVTLINNNKKSTKYTKNILSLELHYQQFITELETQLLNSIDGITDTNQRQKVLEKGLNKANPDSIYNKTLSKYQMRREYYEGSTFKSPIKVNEFKGNQTNNETIMIKARDGQIDLGEGEKGNSNLNKLIEKYEDNKEELIKFLIKNSPEDYDRTYWLNRTGG